MGLIHALDFATLMRHNFFFEETIKLQFSLVILVLVLTQNVRVVAQPHAELYILKF